MTDERERGGGGESLSGELDRKLEWLLRCATTDLGLALREALRGFEPRRLRERALARRPQGDDEPGYDEAGLVLAAVALESLASPHEDAEATVERCLTPAWLRAAGVCLETVTLRPGMPVTDGQRRLSRDLPVEDLGGGGPFMVWDSFATLSRAARLGWAHSDSLLRVRSVTESEIALLRSVPGGAVEDGGGSMDAREALRVRIDAAMAILSGDEAELPDVDEGSRPGVGGGSGARSRVNLLGSTVVTPWSTAGARDEAVADEEPGGGRRALLWGGGVAVAVLVALAAWLGWKALNPPASTGAQLSTTAAVSGGSAGAVGNSGEEAAAQAGAAHHGQAVSVGAERDASADGGGTQESEADAAASGSESGGVDAAVATASAAQRAAAQRAAAEQAAVELAAAAGAAEKAAAEKAAAEKAAAEKAAAEKSAAEKAAAEKAAAEKAAAEKAAAEKAAAEKAAAEKAAAEKAAAKKDAAEKAAAEKAAAEKAVAKAAAEKAAAEKAAAEKAAAEKAAAKAAAEKAAAEKAAAKKAAAERAAAEKAAAEKAAAEKAAAAKAAAENAAAAKAAAAKAAAEKAAAAKVAATQAAAEKAATEAAAQKAAANVAPGKLPSGFHPTLQLSHLAKLYAGEDGRAIKLREWPGGKLLMGRCAVQPLAAGDVTFRIYQGYRPGRLLCTGDLRPLCDALGCPAGATCDVGMAWLQGCAH